MVKAEEIWVEKYRPEKLSEIVGQDEVVSRLQSFVDKKSLPHLLFAGPPGSGKTTAALCIAHELFGTGWRQNLLDLNASDERGIDVIRTKVKDYARTRPIGDFPYKIIYLDESDALTSDAQNALRRTMEMYTHTCRFILACVSPDTKVLLPNETEKPISGMEQDLKAGVLNVDLNRGDVQNDIAIYHVSLDPRIIGKQTLHLKTTTGRELYATEDHLLWTPFGWRRVADLSSGDKVAVFPHLEGTEPAEDDRTLISEEDFKEFLYLQELRCGLDPKNSSYGKLPTKLRQEINGRILGLYQKLKSGLTKREKEIFDIIISFGCPSRLEIQQRVGLSRIWTVQLLKSLEKKGCIQRCIGKDDRRIHRFRALKKDVDVLRNKADIRRKIEQEFRVRLSYSTVRNVIAGGRKSKYHAEHILAELMERGLLPLTYRHPKAGLIARLTGFLLGDGHITKNRWSLIFNGDQESLEEVKRDLKTLGYKPPRTFSKKATNEIRGRSFTGTTTWFRLNSRPLSSLFEFLGVPPGDKCMQEFYVPAWVKDGPKLVKREFLRGLFGSELSAPKCIVRNFEALVFRQHKVSTLANQARRFSIQVKKLLSEFGVESNVSIKPLEHPRKSGEKMVMLNIILGASNQNLYRFFSRVGYVYSMEKERLGGLAAEYLKHKLNTIEERRKRAEDISVDLRSGLSFRAIAKKHDCSPDFVSTCRKAKEVHLPRSFPTFKEWRDKYAFNGSSLVWNEIAAIEEVEVNQVYDIGCLHRHNFITNGIVSHNCNYSSRIIEPIQSRCAVFRFGRLAEKDITTMLKRIARAEKLTLDEDGIKAIIYVSEGDMRRAINVLQAAATLKRKVDEKVIYSVSSAARPEEVKGMLTLALAGKFEEARSKLFGMLINQGLAGEDVLQQVHREVMNLDLPEPVKVKLIDKVGEVDFRLTEGANERIQLEALLAHFCLIGDRLKTT